ncbi:unnamed protein product [Didymodactylos carnosus]|uniref:Rab-like protein 5 n=1 Tax=Didymodactylos carnosus TaxID=1234261 RepID=A0A813VAW5_9BILA|nr:unnamed protein product [Didymodactylos carnosus]CAF3621160.1 unnamed protein product [Didymodactylos carnosus]
MCGKTSFINFATEQRESLTDHYVPTIPVRIIEYDSPLTIKGKTVSSTIEIWDCSGDMKFENTWPALSHKLNGTVFVFDEDEEEHSKELNLWYSNFVEKPNVPERCCLIVASNKTQNHRDAKLSSLFNDIPRVSFNGQSEEIEPLKNTFADYLKKVVTETSRGQDDEKYM